MVTAFNKTNKKFMTKIKLKNKNITKRKIVYDIN